MKIAAPFESSIKRPLCAIGGEGGREDRVETASNMVLKKTLWFFYILVGLCDLILAGYIRQMFQDLDVIVAVVECKPLSVYHNNIDHNDI